MRRPPEVGLVVLLLLGLSGCAGLQQRLSWSSPSTTDVGRTDPPAPSRVLMVASTRRRAPAAQGPVSKLAESSKAAPATADTKLPLNSWPDPPSDGFSRYFPMLSRRWDRGRSERVDATSTGRLDVSRVSAARRRQPNLQSRLMIEPFGRSRPQTRRISALLVRNRSWDSKGLACHRLMPARGTPLRSSGVDRRRGTRHLESSHTSGRSADLG